MNNSWREKKVQITGKNRELREKELERVKTLGDKWGWKFVQFDDPDTGVSQAYFMVEKRKEMIRVLKHVSKMGAVIFVCLVGMHFYNKFRGM